MHDHFAFNTIPQSHPTCVSLRQLHYSHLLCIYPCATKLVFIRLFVYLPGPTPSIDPIFTGLFHISRQSPAREAVLPSVCIEILLLHRCSFRQIISHRGDRETGLSSGHGVTLYESNFDTFLGLVCSASYLENSTEEITTPTRSFNYMIYKLNGQISKLSFR